MQRSGIRRFGTVVIWIALTPLILLCTVLGALFLHFTSLPWSAARTTVAMAFVLAVLICFIFLRPRWKALIVFVVLFGCVFAWFSLIPASNTRQWAADVAQTPYSERTGDQLVIHNVRNFSYRSTEDYDAAWETRTYSLSGLRTLDMYFVYWGSTNIAHTMLSFGFEDGQYLCLSVETRREIGETYSPVASFFKKFELIYVLADERDLVALRTHHRRENAYLFPSRMSLEEIRRLLDDILARVNSLHERPEFYRTIRDNCTTSLLGHINRARNSPITFDVSLLFNGWYPERAYREGAIPQDAPFEEVMKRFAISEKARAVEVSVDFSHRIREGLVRP